MNPPTIGHGKLMDKLGSVAGKSPYFIYLSQSQDSKKNPLSYSDKIKHARKMFPKHARRIMSDKKVKTVFDAASLLYDQGFKNVSMVVGSDRIREFNALLTKYNGVKGRHGFYNFETINIVSAGERDPDSSGVEGMSASKQRENAFANDFASFAMGTPKTMSNKDTKKLFNDIRAGMGLKEETEFKRHVRLEPVSEEREEYVKGNLFELGDTVRIKESDQIGKVSWLGSNYVVVNLNEGKTSRKWITDVEKYEEPAPVVENTAPRKYKSFIKKNLNKEAVNPLDRAKLKIDKEKEGDKVKHDKMLDRARILAARTKNRETNPYK
jgi:hypothetical protein